jgi:hypothetical protein
MADTKPQPDKIEFGIGSGSKRAMVKLSDNTYADRIAPAYGSGIVTDNTGEFTFDIVSLASKMTYDADGNQTSIIYGPDMAGRRIMQTSQWSNGMLMSDSDWQLVDADGKPVKGDGRPK